MSNTPVWLCNKVFAVVCSGLRQYKVLKYFLLPAVDVQYGFLNITKRQWSRSGMLWSGDEVGSQESMQPADQSECLAFGLFPSTACCFPSLCLCPISFVTHSSYPRGKSMAPLIEPDLWLLTTSVARRWANLPWGFIWRGGRLPKGTCRASLLGLPSSPSSTLLATASSFLVACMVWIIVGVFFLPATTTPGKPQG